MFLPLELKVDIFELTLAYKRVQTFFMHPGDWTYSWVEYLKCWYKSWNKNTLVFHTKQADEIFSVTELYFQGMHSVAINLKGLVPWPFMGGDC